MSVLGLVGQGSLYEDMIEQVREVAPADLVEPLENFLASATSNDAAGITFAISLVIGLNGASGALAAAGRGLNVVLGVQDDRGLVHRKLHDMGWTLLLILLVTVAMALILLGGPLATWIFEQIGLGDTAVAVWTIARWPLAILVMMLVYAIVYRVAPDADERRFRFLTPGAVLGVLGLGAGLGRVLPLRLQLQLVQPHLRRLRDRRDPADLALALQPLPAGRRRDQRRARRAALRRLARARGPRRGARSAATPARPPRMRRRPPAGPAPPPRRHAGLAGGLALVALAMLALLPARRAR